MARRVIHLALMLSLAAATGASQVAFRYFYDPNGQLIRAVDSSGNMIQYIYDSSGNPIQVLRSTVNPGTVAIFNLVPLSGQAGQTLTIQGQNFSSTAGNDTVMINGVAATVLSASATQLVVQIPSGVTSGPVSVTVGGVTATFNVNFTVLPVPAITSITPQYGSLGQRLGSVTVNGSSFTPATTFQLAGAGAVTGVSVTSSTQATIGLIIYQNISTGYYVLTANTNGVASSSIPTPGNTFFVMFPAGDNNANLRFSTFNSAYPTTSNLVIPAGSNAANAKFSTFNSAYPTASNLVIPAGSNAASQKFSTFNSVYPTTSSLKIPSGSNEAFRLFSTENNATGTSATTLSVRHVTSASPGLSTLPAPATTFTGAGSTLIAGQSVEIAVNSPLLMLQSLDFEVNRVPLASSATSPLEVLFTVPCGASQLKLKATAQTSTGVQSDSSQQTVNVIPDPGRTVSGRVIGSDGQPVAGATVGWQTNGLAAEYYRFNRSLTEIPDLTGLVPTRTGYVSALNYPNPQQVFGIDPMGIGLGPNSAARFRGSITAETAGTYRFLLRANAGARLSIDGAVVAAEAEVQAETELSAGRHEIEVVYYGNGGPSSLQLVWTKPGGVPEVVPPSAIQAEALRGWTAVTGEDGRFVLRVPAALDGLSVKLARAEESVELDQ